MADDINDIANNPEKAKKLLDLLRGKSTDYSTMEPSEAEQMAVKSTPYYMARDNASSLQKLENSGHPEGLSPSDIPTPTTKDYLKQFLTPVEGEPVETPTMPIPSSPQRGLFHKDDSNYEPVGKEFEPLAKDTSDISPLLQAKGHPTMREVPSEPQNIIEDLSKYKDINSVNPNETRLEQFNRYLAAAKEKLPNIPSEISAKVLPKITPALELAGKAAKPFALAGALSDASAVGQNIDTGNYNNAGENTFGVGSNLAMLSGNPALAATGGAYQAGQGVRGVMKAATGGSPEESTDFNEANRTPTGSPPTQPPVVPPDYNEKQINPFVHTNMVGDLPGYPDLSTSMGSTPERISSITESAKRWGVPPSLSLATAEKESGFNPKAFNAAGGGTGAHGLFQVRTPAYEDIKKNYPDFPYSFEDVQKDEKANTEAGNAYLSIIKKNYGGDTPEKLLSQYNQGPGGDQSKEGQEYAKDVMNRSTKYSDSDMNRSPQSTNENTPEAERRFQIFANTPQGENIAPNNALLNFGAVANTPEGREQYAKDIEDQKRLLDLKSRYNAIPDAVPSSGPTPTKSSTTSTATSGPKISDLQQYLNGRRLDSLNTVAGLRDAQERQNNAELAANLGRSADIFSAGLATAGSKQKVVPTGQEVFKDLAAQSQNIVKNYQDLSAKEKEDPSSAYSTNLRSFMSPIVSKLGLPPNIFQGMSAKQIDESAPWAIKAYEAQKLAEEKLEATKGKNIDKQAVVADKYDTAQEKAINATKDKIVMGRGGMFNQLNAAKLQADRIFNTLGIDPHNPTSEAELAKLGDKSMLQIAESAIETNKLLSGSGAPAQATFKRLMPDNFMTRATDFYDKMSNDKNPAHQAAYLRQILGITQRARDAAIEMKQELAQEALSGFANVNADKTPKAHASLSNVQDTLDLYPNDRWQKIKAIRQSHPDWDVKKSDAFLQHLDAKEAMTNE